MLTRTAPYFPVTLQDLVAAVLNKTARPKLGKVTRNTSVTLAIRELERP